MPEIKPRFEIERLKGKQTRRIAKQNVDDNGKLLGGFTFHDTEVDAGWMVYFPSGASIHVWTEAEMLRQGFLSAPDLVDMESGEVVGTTRQESLKAKSEQIANRPRKGALAAIQST